MAEITNARILRTIPTLVIVLTTLCTASVGRTIYVDNDATGANNGTSWENAYVYLQDALADANESAKPVEIRVSQGIYKPDQGAGITVGDREATFQLINGVSLKGGFAGLGAADPNARDVEVYETILTGDLRSDDVGVDDPWDLANQINRWDNGYHVVSGSGTDETAVLDGFVVTGGNDNRREISYGPPRRWHSIGYGAGMHNSAGCPTVISCTFQANFANAGGGGVCNENNSNPILTNCTLNGNQGGGMLNRESRPTLVNCTFNGNQGSGMTNRGSSPSLTKCAFISNLASGGGGMHNFWESRPVLTNCTFSGNSAFAGGGMLNRESSPTLANCIFTGNLSVLGSGMMNYADSNATVTNCTFCGNSAESGGGVYNMYNSTTKLTNCTSSGNSAVFGGGMDSSWESSPILTNCTFSGNWADLGGGGMYNFQSSPTLTNCTFSVNFADEVGGMFASWDRSSTLTNCILWGNTFPQLAGDTVASYSDVQGGWTGEGNINADPLFADPGYWANVNDPNMVVEPNDPNAVWIDGDYHLKSEAGRWDTISQSWVIDGVTSPCIDAGDPNRPVGDEPQPNGGRINMGAYGGTAEASKSVFNPVHGTSRYTFLSDQSTVVQTGGIAGVHRTYVIKGQFQLSIDPIAPNAGVALFTHVDANATDDSPYRRTLDPNEVFNMTGLTGTVIGDVIIVFTGKAADGSDILIIAILNNDLVYLVGRTFPPAGSADFFIFSLDAVAQRKYGGGTGEPNNPYLIYTAEQMNTIGTEPNDWDKHFKLMADIDLVEYKGTEFNLIGSLKTPFTGVFDGNVHTISNFIYDCNGLTYYVGLFGYVRAENTQIKHLGLIDPNVDAGTGIYVGSLVGELWSGTITNCYVQHGSVAGNVCVGGLVGYNGKDATWPSYIPLISNSYSTANVSGNVRVGGLVGENWGTITSCYATSNVLGDRWVGGLVGSNGFVLPPGARIPGVIANCYSSGNISANEGFGGLLGSNWCGTISNCYSNGSVSGTGGIVGGLVGRNMDKVLHSFWDIQTSGQLTSDGGTGKTTAEMQTAATFLEAGWDFVDETENGTEDIWWILEGKDYPRLTWELLTNDHRQSPRLLVEDESGD